MSAIDSKATLWQCDAPACSAQKYLPYGERPDGYHGTAYQTGSWGGGADGPWYACKQAHIKPAVLAAIERAESAERE